MELSTTISKNSQIVYFYQHFWNFYLIKLSDSQEITLNKGIKIFERLFNRISSKIIDSEVVRK